MDASLGIDAARQRLDLDQAERLLLMHLWRHSDGPDMWRVGLNYHVQEQKRDFQGLAVSKQMNCRFPPEWTLDHRTWKAHHQVHARLHRAPDGSLNWTPVPTSTDSADSLRWASYGAFRGYSEPLSRWPFPIAPPVGVAKRSHYPLTVAFHFTGSLGESSLLNAARLAISAPHALLVQIDQSHTQRHFLWQPTERRWDPETSPPCPWGPVRVLVTGHPTFFPNDPRPVLSGLSSAELVSRLQRSLTSLADASTGAHGVNRPDRISLVSCALDTPVSPWSYGADVLRLAAQAFDRPALTVTVRSRAVRADLVLDAANPTGTWRKAVVRDDPNEMHRHHPLMAWRDTPARETPGATWILRLGTDGIVERADKYPHGGKAWVTDDLLADPPPSAALVEWLGPRPSTCPALADQREWRSAHTHAMLGEVWIGMDLLRRMGVLLDGAEPVDVKRLQVPGTYARLRLRPCRLVAFVRAWPPASELVTAFRLLRQLSRDEVPALAAPSPTATARQLRSHAQAQDLLHAIEESVGTDLTLSEALWRHLQ